MAACCLRSQIVAMSRAQKLTNWLWQRQSWRTSRTLVARTMANWLRQWQSWQTSQTLVARTMANWLWLRRQWQERLRHDRLNDARAVVFVIEFLLHLLVFLMNRPWLWLLKKMNRGLLTRLLLSHLFI